MKKYLCIILILIATGLFGQITRIPNSKTSGVNIGVQARPPFDTTFKVVYLNSTNSLKKPPLIFLNGQLINSTLFNTINPKSIESINIAKGDKQLEDTFHHGQIEIKTKDNYNIQPISLNQLKHKYTSLKKETVIFTVDNELITENYDNYFVDENYLLRMTIENTKIINEKKAIIFIKILTKSENNINNIIDSETKN